MMCVLSGLGWAGLVWYGFVMAVNNAMSQKTKIKDRKKINHNEQRMAGRHEQIHPNQ